MSGEERYPPFEQLGSGRTEGSGIVSKSRIYIIGLKT